MVYYNLEQNKILFSKNTPKNRQREICNSSKSNQEMLAKNTLVFLLLSMVLPNNSFMISSSKPKQESQIGIIPFAEKITLINHVLNTISLYYMNSIRFQQ